MDREMPSMFTVGWPEDTTVPCATDTDVVVATTDSPALPKSAASWMLAGAIIEDDTGLMNVKADTMTATPISFRRTCCTEPRTAIARSMGMTACDITTSRVNNTTDLLLAAR
jgi:hypothetical protein